MSTAGSVRSGEGVAYGPPSSGEGEHDARRAWRVALFRWRGIIPLALGLALVALVYALFAERVLRSTIQEGGTKALGTEVDVGSVAIHARANTLELRDIAIADPFDARRNLLEVTQLSVELEPEPLLEKKLIVRHLTIGDVRTGTTRRVPARAVPNGGFAPAALKEMQRWAEQFDVPILSLTPVDTIKSIVLDPTQLASIKAAIALGQRTDSTRLALDRSFGSLPIQATLDSSRALLTRLQGLNLRTLGIAGARSAVGDVRRATARVDSLRRQVEALATTAHGAVDQLQQGIAGVDSLRRSDYEFARRLIKLPSVDAPDIGAALFGKVTIDKVQQALYWTDLARQYMPPGLLPKESAGPKRLRASGTTVHFVAPQVYPRFLLQRGDLDLTVTDGPARGRYIAAVTDVTSEPALVGRPTVFALRRVATGSALDSLRLTAMLDHTTSRPREVITMQAGGVALPTLPIPGLPYHAAPGRGDAQMRLTMDGDQLDAQGAIASGTLVWQPDSAARKLNAIESLVVRVLAGVQALTMNARLSGPVRSPTLSVRSNLDRVVADQLRSVVGAQVAAAEAKLRTRVDSLVNEKASPVKERVATLRTQLDQRIADARAKLDSEKQKLDAQIKALSGGLLGGLGHS